MAAGDLTSKDAVEAALLRSLTPDEDALIDGLIQQVSDRLRGRRPDIDALIAQWVWDPRPPTAVSPANTASVLAEVLTRKLNNPKGLWSRTESSGEGPYNSSESETYAGARGGTGASSTGGIEITDDDLRQILGTRTGRRRGTIRLSIG